MAIIAIIPAAGSGSRMQAGVNKQYLLLAGRPILLHTLKIFENHPRIDRIVIVSPKEEIDYCRNEIVQLYNLQKVSDIIAGGETRQESVRNALAACSTKENDILIVHDGARPLLSAKHLDSLIDTTLKNGAATLGVPVKDTITKVLDGIIIDTPDRSCLWQVQTPQAFRASLLKRAHDLACRDGFAATDDTMLVKRLNHEVMMVEGSYRNIKITTPEDLLIATAFYMKEGC